MGLLGIVAIAAAVLVAGAVGVGAYAYATDSKVGATIQDTDCAKGEVDVKTKRFGIDHTVKRVPIEQCQQLEPGNFVEYRLRSQRTTLYDAEGGRCIYDSVTGPFCGNPPFLVG